MNGQSWATLKYTEDNCLQEQLQNNTQHTFLTYHERFGMLKHLHKTVFSNATANALNHLTYKYIII